MLEFSAHEENSEVLLEALDPVIMKPSFSAESFSEHPTVGLAASQLCMWVQGVVRLHNSLQTKIRPLHLKVTNMKASLSEYSDKLKKEENKVASYDSTYSGTSYFLLLFFVLLFVVCLFVFHLECSLALNFKHHQRYDNPHSYADILKK